MVIFDHFQGSQYGKLNGHTWLSNYCSTWKPFLHVLLYKSEVVNFITTVGVNEALSFLSTFILYIIYCFMTNRCVLKQKLCQGFLILFFSIFKFASKNSMIAQMSCQYAH